MKEGRINILGKEYPACLSTRMMIKVTEKTGKPFQEGIAELLDTNNIDGMFWVLSEMLEAGKRYHDLIGDKTPQPPTLDTLLDSVGLDSFNDLSDAIFKAAVSTSTADVEIEADEKN